ncbi:hypothetical protein HDV01_001607 [Terramyces sp. JEL0728]|nr:hypothetical protein HDV01_001607 [Terramyces sp. JEL0728]
MTNNQGNIGVPLENNTLYSENTEIPTLLVYSDQSQTETSEINVPSLIGTSNTITSIAETPSQIIESTNILNANVQSHKGVIDNNMQTVDSRAPKRLRISSGASKNCPGIASTFVESKKESTTISSFQSYYRDDIDLSSGLEYRDWKNRMCQFYSNPISALTIAYDINLEGLDQGNYLLGSAQRCDEIVIRSDICCPSCPDILGEIHINDTGDIVFTISKDLKYGGMKFKLVSGAEFQITDTIRFWVNKFNVFYLYDITRTAYTSILGKNDIFLPYDDTLIFDAEVVGKNELWVKSFGGNAIFHVVHTEEFDPHTTGQKTFPIRIVNLHPVGANIFKLNFNFSYPVFVDDQYIKYVNKLHNYQPGMLVNMFNRDGLRVLNALMAIYNGLNPLIFIAINLLVLYKMIGTVALCSFGVLGSIFVISYFLSNKYKKLTVSANLLSDSRLDSIRELLNAVKTEKFLANKAMSFIVSRLKVALSKSTSIVTAAVTFIVYGIAGNTLDPAIVFPAYMYLDSFTSQLSSLNYIVLQLLTFQESYDLISDYFHSEEIVPVEQREFEQSVAIKTVNVKWKWYDADYLKKLHAKRLEALRRGNKKQMDESNLKENKDTFELEKFSIEIEKGTLVGIVGAAGSGKTTMFNGLVNELLPLEGEVHISGQIAYATQLPWIMMDSIHSNITFGKPLDQERLVECIEACGLVKDLNALEQGMFTKIGEKGINLSGGQKARVSLARCLYADADIYLLDDPLAALDAYVGKSVFEQAIKKRLSKKTVLLATHQLQYMQQMDKIIVLENGQVAESGTFNELISKPNGLFSKMMASYHCSGDEEAQTQLGESKEDLKITTAPSEITEIILKEKKATGEIKFDIYRKLFGPVASIFWSLPVVFGYILDSSLEFLAIIILTAWSTDTSGSTAKYMKALGLAAFGRVFVNYVLTVIWYNGGLKVYKYYFNKFTSSIFHAALHVFEENPIGRILNRYSFDLSLLDEQIFLDLNLFISRSLSILGKSVIVLVLAIAAVGTIAVQKKFEVSYLELSRIYMIDKSTRTTHISETFSGVRAISLFGSEKYFKEKYYKLNDAYISVPYLNDCNFFLYRLKIGLLNVLVTIGIVLAAYLFNQHSTIFSALMNSFERVLEYCEEIDQEAPTTTPADEKAVSWPSSGEIHIKDLSLAYHSKPKVDVIKNLTVSISAGERIGVVGRTGSGKSTLGTAFFRLMEPKTGSIVIDDIDICTLGLEKLRTSIQMISQEANLFSGSVRFNLTLEADITDEELWVALDKVGLKEFISQMPEKLGYPLLAGGSNLSVGQGQLLCLARAIAKKPKVLILDEASSSVDGEADQMIQKVLKEELKGSTVVSIAHRLNTIADFDRIMVLEQGEIVEFDTPSSLLQNPESLFSKLVEATGEANSLAIKEIANQNKT